MTSGLKHPSGLPDLTAEASAPAMVFMDHLQELRSRLIISVLALLLAGILAFFAAEPVILQLKHLAPAGVRFVQISPAEALLATCHVTVLLALALASPILLYQILRFVLPGLHGREKRFLIGGVLAGALLFLAGMAFAYWAVLPPTLAWLLDFGRNIAENQLSIARFVDFCVLLLLMTGVMFELPMLLFLLSFTGLVTSKKLLAQWRMATVVIFLAAAILTPSQDPFSMTVVGLAMVALYFLSIVPIRLIGR